MEKIINKLLPLKAYTYAKINIQDNEYITDNYTYILS